MFHPETFPQSLTSWGIVMPFGTSFSLVNSKIRLISRPESSLLSKREDPLTIRSYWHINELTRAPLDHEFFQKTNRCAAEAQQLVMEFFRRRGRVFMEEPFSRLIDVQLPKCVSVV